MRPSPLTPRRALWLACACLLLIPSLAAAAESLLAADFDGDGRRDQVMLDRRQPSVLQVWLSASGTTQEIYRGAPLQELVAADLDGDHRPELIARDSGWHLHVWTPQRKGFRSYRPFNVLPLSLRHSTRRSVDDDDEEPVDIIPSTALTHFALALCPLPRAPAHARASGRVSPAVRARRSVPSSDPFAPRPPPALHSL